MEMVRSILQPEPNVKSKLRLLHTRRKSRYASISHQMKAPLTEEIGD